MTGDSAYLVEAVGSRGHACDHGVVGPFRVEVESVRGGRIEDAVAYKHMWLTTQQKIADSELTPTNKTIVAGFRFNKIIRTNPA